MREVHVDLLREAVKRLCQQAACVLPQDVMDALRCAQEREESPLGRRVLEQIVRNAELAQEEMLPICQDTGVAVIFLEVGQDVHLVGGDLMDALRRGVSEGYREGYLRASMVERPFSARINTRDNTPPIVHMDIVPGDRVRLRLMPKGAGCENVSRLAMLLPGAGREGVMRFVTEAVEDAGGKPCPPVIVGVGIGGTAEYAMLLAKKALLRPVGQPHPDAEVAALEAELLRRVNALGIGPQGVGGKVTALAVHVEVFPSHIASLPVAVNIQCHAARVAEAVV
ncbi:MAG: fumarate hydratase [Dehalococcoidia bacterium]|nr:fumarate hydratase [Dehalococcoidia bacterium]